MDLDHKLLDRHVTTTAQSPGRPGEHAVIVGVAVSGSDRPSFLLAFDDGSMEFYDYRFVTLPPRVPWSPRAHERTSRGDEG